MPREILSDNSAAPAQPLNLQPAAEAASPALTPAEPVLSADALAGALPDWDLLPASPFVRRVK